MVVFQGEEYARASSCICWVEIKRNIINVGFRIYVLNIFAFFFLRGRHIHSFFICGEDIFSFVCVCVCVEDILIDFFFICGEDIFTVWLCFCGSFMKMHHFLLKGTYLFQYL